MKRNEKYQVRKRDGRSEWLRVSKLARSIHRAMIAGRDEGLDASLSSGDGGIFGGGSFEGGISEGGGALADVTFTESAFTDVVYTDYTDFTDGTFAEGGFEEDGTVADGWAVDGYPLDGSAIDSAAQDVHPELANEASFLGEEWRTMDLTHAVVTGVRREFGAAGEIPTRCLGEAVQQALLATGFPCAAEAYARVSGEQLRRRVDLQAAMPSLGCDEPPAFVVPRADGARTADHGSHGAGGYFPDERV